MAHVLRFSDGKVRQDDVDVGVSEVVVGIVLEMTVQEQQRRVKHEKGEGEMERYDTCAMNFFGDLEPCVYMHTHEDVRSTLFAEKCACDWCVCNTYPPLPLHTHTHPRTHSSCY